MKKRILTIIITLAMAMGMISAATTTVFAADVSKKGTWGEYEEIGGEYKYTYANFSPFVESDRGTMENPYVIDSPSKLAGLAAMVNAYNKGSDVKLTDTYENTVTATNFFKNGESQYIKLTADLDLIGPGWIPIGTDLYNEFKGSFDGNGYTISGMAIGTADKANPECQYAGLFGYMTAGSIKNLSVSGLVNVSYSSKAYAGGIVGYAEAEANAITIENCSSTVSVTASSTGTAYAGGLMGNASSRVTITNCYSTGTVATTTYAGGLVGNASSGVTITNCYNTGTVEATTNAGGLLGIASNTTITNCYSAGGVSGTNAGGFIGNAGSTITIKDCYRIVGIEAIGTGSDSNGSTQELSQDQMQGSAGATDSSWENISIIAKYGSLVDALNKWVESNPSFTPWHIHEGGYPTLGVGETITTNTDGQTHTVTCGCNISTIKEHSGGTATCTEQAKCQHCGASYGEVGGHTPDAAGYTDNGNGTHSSTCAVCGDVTEEHAFDENGTCVCGINLFTVSGSTLTIDGTLGGKTEATEEDITVLVNKIEDCVDSGITTIIVTGSEPALIEMDSWTNTAIGEAIYRLSGSDDYDENNRYNGKIDLILQDVTEIVDQEFYSAWALNSITLPQVIKMGDEAFHRTWFLKTITFESVLTEVNETGGVMFAQVGKEVGGCDLILNCGQMDESSVPAPDLTNNIWKFKFENEFKSITLTHTEGTAATCIAQAVCSVCGESYGEVGGHSPDAAGYTVNADGTHSYTCSSCGNPFTERHTFTDGACTGCGVIGGYCGEEGNEQNVIWTYANGTLTISGTGAMADQFDNYNNRPWEEYVDQITTIVVNDGITSIGEAAFWRFQKLTTAKLPDSLTTISQQAFYGCTALKTVNFPANLKTIEGWAFLGCALESVTLPEGLTTIGYRAFSECKNLTSVTVPASVTTIDEGAFGYSPAKITVAEDNLNYSSDEQGVLFDKDKTTLIYCRPNIEVETYTIPSTVTEICKEAFYGCKNLATITIPDGVQKIGSSAFGGCEALTTITIPAGVTTIEANTFYDCTALTAVTIPAGVTTIDMWAFSGCTALTTVTIPASVTSIAYNAFSNCSALTTVNVPCSWDGSLYTFYEGVTVNKVHNWVGGACTVCGVPCDHKDSTHTAVTDKGDGTHGYDCTVCGTAITGAHTMDITTGKCGACGADMTVVATVTDGTHTYYAADADTLNQAVTAILETGSRTFTVELPADAEAGMITAIRRAICDTEGVADGSIHLTLKGVTSIPGTTNWDGVAFGPRNAQWDENNVEIVSHEEVTQLASVNLPDVTEIGAQAFYFCENLVSVSAPKAQTIGAQALGYTALTSVEFPELTTIPTDMFSGTWTLSSAKFPKVTTIEQNGLMIGFEFAPENNPTPFPLELTAEGDITFNGSYHFNIAERNYTGKVDLVLCCDKKEAVTFHDDGTATWQVREDLSYTFKSITFKHSYVDGKCESCGEDCTHTGGTATCTTPAVCDTCGASYGTVDPDNHDTSVSYDENGFCAGGCYQPALEVLDKYDFDNNNSWDLAYEISNAGQLYWFAKKVNSGYTGFNAVLTADIAVNSNCFASVKNDLSLVFIDANDPGETYAIGTGIGGTTAGAFYVKTGDGYVIVEASDAYNSQRVKELLEKIRPWTPIGNATYGFSGTFDGNGKTISGLYINDSNAGLFGYVTGGTVKDLTLSNSFFNGYQNVGGVVGSLNNGTIKNCTSYATVCGAMTIGGIAGYCSSDAIIDIVYNISGCYNMGIVSAKDYVGGIIGVCENSSVYGCANNGNVISTNACVGGIVGLCNYSLVSGCTNNGNVSGWDYVGGVVGYINGSTVKDCYSDNCTVSGTNYVGGVVGDINGSTVKDCYSDNCTVSGTNYVGGIVGSDLNGTVSRCYNASDVSGIYQVGGVVGYIQGGSVSDCYNTGNISGTENVGGIVGSNSGTVSNCYYLADSEADSIDGTTFKTAAQFASGEVTYLLNGDQATIAWYQTCGTGLPAFSGDTVYKATKGCTGAYVNDQNAEPAHTFTADSNGFCAACGSAYQPAVWNGNVYEISSAGQLYWFAQQVNGGNTYINGKLTANIVVNKNVLTESGELSGDGSNFRVWTPIGNLDEKSYTGTFDGNGKTVSGLYFNATKDFVGLFGWVGDNGTIKNVGVIDSYFHGYSCVGSVVAHNRGTVSECYNKGTVSGRSHVGGVVGRNFNNSVTISTNAGAVINCYNIGKVSGTGNYIGGVVGNNSYGIISNCYNTGKVNGEIEVGGIVGNNLSGTIENCYNIGFISGISNYVGGIAGSNSGTVTNCYYLSGYVVDGNSIVQFGIGSENAGSTTADEAGKTSGKTSAQFASGEVAYLLNGDQSGIVWYQTCGEGLPAYSGIRVYRNQLGGCTEVSYKYEYSNEQKAPVTTHDTTKFTYAKASIVNSITATCGDCRTANWTVTLTAPENAVYNGSFIPATVTGEIPGVKVTVSYNKDPINAGAYTASVTLGDVEASVEYNIAQKVLIPTITGRVTKVYDGTNAVPAGLSIVLEGIVGADNVTASAIYTFDRPDAGTKKVNAECILLSGEKLGNYTLSSSTASADVGEITKAQSHLITAPTAIGGLIYNKQAQPLVTPGAAEFGTIVYSFDCMNWSTSIATAVNAGSYTVFYKVAGDQNHLDTAPAVITVSVAQREVGIIWGQTAFEFNEQRQVPTATVIGVLPGDVCTVGVQGWGVYGGTYTATARSLSNPNYKLPASGTTCQFTITVDYDKEADKVLDGIGNAIGNAVQEHVVPAITNAFNEMLENLFKMFANLFD